MIGTVSVDFPTAPTSTRACAVVVAAGAGVRFGSSPKVLAQLCGKPVLHYSLEAAMSARSVDEVVLVVSSQNETAVTDFVGPIHWPKPLTIVCGGPRRQDSTLNGLMACSAGCSWAAIHDAARPLVTAELFDRSLRAARISGAAITAIAVSDTIKEVESGSVVRTLSRERLRAVQTPQAFRVDLLAKAFEHARTSGLEATDEATLFEALSIPVTVVEGNPANMKITVPADLPLAESLMCQRVTGAAGQ
jgi:2-C-methyl-D-erythritol 4-phosphate cytidylyltransferase